MSIKDNKKEKKMKKKHMIGALNVIIGNLRRHEVLAICGKGKANHQAIEYLKNSSEMLDLQVSLATIPQELSFGAGSQDHCLADPERKIFIVGRRSDMFFRIKKETVLIVGSKYETEVRKFLRQHDLSASFCVSGHFVDFCHNHAVHYQGDLWVVKTHGWFLFENKNSIFHNIEFLL